MGIEVEAGDIDGQAVWKRVLAAVDELMSGMSKKRDRGRD